VSALSPFLVTKQPSVELMMGQLEDLFVKEEHRAQGLGKRLFGELGAIAKERKCGRVEWRVLKVSLGLLCVSLALVSTLPSLVVRSSTRLVAPSHLCDLFSCGSEAIPCAILRRRNVP
jgi:hypothetical protein